MTEFSKKYITFANVCMLNSAQRLFVFNWSVIYEMKKML